MAAVTSLLATTEEASQLRILRSLEYMLRTRTLVWQGTSGQTLEDTFSGIVIEYGDTIYQVGQIPSPALNYGIESLSNEPFEIGRNSVQMEYLLTMSAATKSTPSSTVDDQEARRDAVATLLEIGNFVDRLIASNHRHVDLVDGANTTVGSMVLQRWTGMSRVPGELRMLGRCALSLEAQKTT